LGAGGYRFSVYSELISQANIRYSGIQTALVVLRCDSQAHEQVQVVSPERAGMHDDCGQDDEVQRASFVPCEILFQPAGTQSSAAQRHLCLYPLTPAGTVPGNGLSVLELNYLLRTHGLSFDDEK
jgi:hypothetical protein